MQTPSEPEVRKQLASLFSSSRFKDGGRSRRFLEFIVEESLAGKRGELKENVVGVHVFDRSPDYDPRLDSIVRVEAGRLRTKLSEYYEHEGRDDPVVIALPKGSYAPEFGRRAQEARIEVQDDASSLPTARKRNRWMAVTAATCVLVVGVAVSYAWFSRDAVPSVRIAVLPFTSYSEDTNDQRVARELTDKVTNEFVKIESFDVVPSTSARQFDETRPGVREIATALGADVLLEARTTRVGNRVQVEIRLSDGALNRKFWVGDQFVGDNVQELASRIAFEASKKVGEKWRRQGVVKR